MYNNGTCHSPEETWTQCGTGKSALACHWYEVALTTVEKTVELAFEETFGIIGQGVLGLGSWALDVLTSLFSNLWPMLLTYFGIIALVIITFAMIKAGTANIRRTRK